MKRDWRLLAAAISLTLSAIILDFFIKVQLDWSQAYWTANWREYGKKYHFDVSKAGTTFDYTAPQQEWIGLLALLLFSSALFLVLIAWWKPKK